MNTFRYLVSLIFIIITFHLSAQTNTQNQSVIPSEFTAKSGVVKKTAIQPFKRVVYFDIDETDLNAKSKGVLNNLYKILAANEQLMVQISGHSNGSCDTEYCEELSNTRAESVAFYLMEQGVRPIRLQYNGFGKQKPVGNNRTTTGKKRNQRVEIRVYRNFGDLEQIM